MYDILLYFLPAKTRTKGVGGKQTNYLQLQRPTARIGLYLHTGIFLMFLLDFLKTVCPILSLITNM